MCWPSAEVRAGLGRDRPRTKKNRSNGEKSVNLLDMIFVELSFRDETIKLWAY